MSSENLPGDRVAKSPLIQPVDVCTAAVPIGHIYARDNLPNASGIPVRVAGDSGWIVEDGSDTDRRAKPVWVGAHDICGQTPIHEVGGRQNTKICLRGTKGNGSACGFGSCTNPV